ncbi:MAG: magnesium transporter [Calditrichaeota bacterium]|nr:magnesium transporter [Calditrichota bacterium]
MNLTERLETLQNLLEVNKDAEIRELIAELHAADISEIVNHLSSREDRLKVFSLIDDEELKGAVLIDLEQPLADHILESLEVEDISQIINTMDSDDAADIIGEIAEDNSDLAEKVLDQIEADHKAEVLQLLKYDEDSAGGLMSSSYFAIDESMKVNDIINTIRSSEMDELYNIWVIDSRKRLLGRISLKTVLLAKETKTAAQIMSEDYVYIDVNSKQEDVARSFEKYDLIEAPVVNDKHILLGHITVDDVVDVIEEEAEEDLLRMAGTNDEEVKEISIVKIVKARLPWLVVALLVGLCSSYIIATFHDTLERNVMVSYFITVVIAMGGNVGVQSSTVVIRGLATGDINRVDLSYRMFKELMVSISNGVLVSSILFLIITAWKDYYLAMVCSLSMIMSMFIAGLVGALIPFLLERLKLDPALSSGPFVTTSNDILGVLIYFSVASFFY